jgi:membrane-associated phospholipid phosphatase
MRSRSSLLAAAAGTVLFLLIWFAAFHLGIVKRADQSIFGWFASMHHGAYAAANRVARLCDLKHYVLIAAVPVLIALARGRPLVAVAIATVLIGANVTTQLVKPVFAHPRPSMVLGGVLPSASSWPSGHATAAMSLALVSVLAAPSRLRPLVAALGAIFAAAVSYALLTLRWHYASDVFGGFLVAGVWALLAAGFLAAFDAERPVALRAAVTPAVVALLGALALVAAVAVARPDAILVHALTHATFAVGAASIAAVALALTTGVMLVLQCQQVVRAR